MINFYQLMIRANGGIYNGSIQAGIYRIYACLISKLPEMSEKQVLLRGAGTWFLGFKN